MPEENNKAVRYDVDGYDIITDALNQLMDDYAGFYEDAEIEFSTLEQDGGIGWFPVNGSMVLREFKSVTGKVVQTCNYPFYVVFRVSDPQPKRKVLIKEILDSLGRWLEGQTVKIEGTEHRLTSYPELTGKRKITAISRQAPGYLSETNKNIEDWVIQIALSYTNEFYRGEIL